MTLSKRVTAVVAAATLGATGFGAAAQAESHWSSSACSSWKKSYLQRHKHPTKEQKSKANKVLKAHGCSTRVK